MISSTILISAAGGGFLLCILILCLSFRKGYAAQAEDRLQNLAPSSGSLLVRRNAASLSRDESPRTGSTIAAYGIGLLQYLIPSSKPEQLRHQSRLFHAGIYYPSALWRFFAVKLMLMITPLVIGLTLAMQRMTSLRTGMLLGVTVGAFGAILPSFWLDRQIRRRHAQLRRSLPDFLDLMIVCLDGGLSLHGAIQRVSDEFQLAHPILAREMQTVQRDVDLGATIEVALRNLADRTGLDSLRTLSTFVRESLRFGTEVAEALRQHADMLRDQREQCAEEQAQRASVQILLPTLLLILPAVFVVVAGPAGIQIQEAFAKRATK